MLIFHKNDIWSMYQKPFIKDTLKVFDEFENNKKVYELMFNM